jgi:hypothetical protein
METNRGILVVSVRSSAKHQRSMIGRGRLRPLNAVACAAVLGMGAAMLGAVPAHATGTLTVTATIPIGIQPYGVAVDPGTHTASVTNYSNNGVGDLGEPGVPGDHVHLGGAVGRGGGRADLPGDGHRWGLGKLGHFHDRRLGDIGLHSVRVHGQLQDRRLGSMVNSP